MSSSIRAILLCLAVMLSNASCENMGRDKDSDNGSDKGGDRISSGRGSGDSLYERIGGEPVLSKVIDDTIERARVDRKINWSREGAPQGWQPTQENFEDFKRGLTRYVSQQIGGKDKYEGADMRSVHEGMQITNEEFDAFMNHVRGALSNNNVAEKERQELVRVFEGTRKQIVQQPRQQQEQRQPDRDRNESQRSQ